MISFEEKPYHSLDQYLKSKYGQKIYKVAIDGGFNCPNRDGKLSYDGCIFCSIKGSGDFTGNRHDWLKQIPETTVTKTEDPYGIMSQIHQGIKRLSNKVSNGRYIAYFQSFTNTYDTVEHLRERFDLALSHPDIIGLAIGTRPDCLSDGVLSLLAHYNQNYEVLIELGLQTIHSKSAMFINRGYPLSIYDDAIAVLKSHGIKTVTHMILGLPNETSDMMIETAKYIGKTNTHGIKFHLLHILEHTKLGALYKAGQVSPMEMSEYIQTLIDCIEWLPPSMVIHRITGDGDKSQLLAPLWSGNKRLVLNTIHQTFKKRQTYQGRMLEIISHN